MIHAYSLVPSRLPVGARFPARLVIGIVIAAFVLQPALASDINALQDRIDVVRGTSLRVDCDSTRDEIAMIVEPGIAGSVQLARRIGTDRPGSVDDPAPRGARVTGADYKFDCTAAGGQQVRIKLRDEMVSWPNPSTRSGIGMSLWINGERIISRLVVARLDDGKRLSRLFVNPRTTFICHVDSEGETCKVALREEITAGYDPIEYPTSNAGDAPRWRNHVIEYAADGEFCNSLLKPTQVSEFAFNGYLQSRIGPPSGGRALFNDFLWDYVDISNSGKREFIVPVFQSFEPYARPAWLAVVSDDDMTGVNDPRGEGGHNAFLERWREQVRPNLFAKSPWIFPYDFMEGCRRADCVNKGSAAFPFRLPGGRPSVGFRTGSAVGVYEVQGRTYLTLSMEGPVPGFGTTARYMLAILEPVGRARPRELCLFRVVPDHW